MNLYIGNLNFRIREGAIRQLFEEYGEITSLNLIKDRDTNRLKGFGFIEFANEGDAKRAIENLNGKELEGRPLVVREANPR